VTTQAAPVALQQAVAVTAPFAAQLAAIQRPLPQLAALAAMAAQMQRALAPLVRQLDALARAVEQARAELARRAQVRLRAGQVAARRRLAALCAVAAQLWQGRRAPGDLRRPSSTVLLAAYRSNAPNLHACAVTTERQRT
jgi:hypothetical protein